MVTKKPNNKTTPTSPTHINHEGVNLVDREEEDPSLLGRQSLELLACLVERPYVDGIGKGCGDMGLNVRYGVRLC